MASLVNRNGIYHLYWRENGKQRSRAIGPLSEQEAKQYKRDFETNQYRGKAGLTLKNIKFKDFCDEYIRVVSMGEKRPSSVDRDKRTIATFIRLFPKIVIVDQFNDFVVSEYKAKRRTEGVKDSSINRELGTLKNMGKFALKKTYTDKPINVGFYEVSKVNRELVLTGVQIKALFETINEPFTTACMLGLYAGLRAGEACNLTWANVGDGVLRIRPCGDWMPKNKTSNRNVPIHPALAKHLKQAQKRARGAEYVVSYESGERLKETVLASMFTKFRKDTKIDGLCFHVLRHTFVSRMAECGADIFGISKIVGHSTATITQQVYTHLKDSYYQKNINKLSIKIG